MSPFQLSEVQAAEFNSLLDFTPSGLFREEGNLAEIQPTIALSSEKRLQEDCKEWVHMGVRVKSTA